MKKLKAAGILAVLMVWLTACGSGVDAEQETVNSLILDKDGSVENMIIEGFDKDYYDLDGLNAMIKDSIEQYCRQNPSADITLKGSEVSDGQVRVSMKYDSAASYMGYNNKTLFVGTIQEAYSEGYDLNISLTDVKDSSNTVGKQELLEMGEKHIVIIQLPSTMTDGMRLQCFGEILYISDGVNPVSKKTADIEQSQGVSVVVFK